jgi:uncharacterized protein YukE
MVLAFFACSRCNQLLQEISSQTSKVSAMLVEQRELRNHWAQEKNELESRMFQLTALQTQVEGTMKKKEKEFEKLQTLLQKQVKDSQQGQKVGVTVSKPIPKNSSQTKVISAGAALLRDAEFKALAHTMGELTSENLSLRTALDTINQHTSALQTQFESSVGQLTAKYHREQEELIEQINQLQESLEQSNQRPVQLEAKSPAHKKPNTNYGEVDVVSIMADNVEASQLLAASAKKQARTLAFSSPAVQESESAAETFIVTLATSSKDSNNEVSTPFARPVNFVIDQAVSELKQLSQTMNETLMNELADNFEDDNVCKSPEVSTFASSMSAMKRGRVSFGGGAASSSNTDIIKLRKMSEEVDRLKSELLCAMKQIHVQDQLIHQALLGQLPGLSAACVMADFETEAEEMVSSEATEPAEAINTVMDSPLKGDNYDFDLEEKFSLPPGTRRYLLTLCHH